MESNSFISRIVCLCDDVALDVVATGIAVGDTCVAMLCVPSVIWHNIELDWSVASSHGL